MTLSHQLSLVVLAPVAIAVLGAACGGGAATNSHHNHHGNSHLVKMSLAPAGTVRGRVIEGGGPYPGRLHGEKAIMYLTDVSSGAKLKVATNAHGFYSLKVPTGTYRVVADTPGFSINNNHFFKADKLAQVRNAGTSTINIEIIVP